MSLDTRLVEHQLSAT